MSAHVKSSARARKWIQGVITVVGVACWVASAQRAAAQGVSPSPGASPPASTTPPGGAGPPPDGAPRRGPPAGALAAFRAKLAADMLPLAGHWPPPSPDSRNFEGFWRNYNILQNQRTSDMFGAKPPLNEAGSALLAKRMAADQAGRPYANASSACLPPGQPEQLDINLPFVVHQNENWIEFLFQMYHGAWTVVFDPAKQPDADVRPYLGRSVGHWDGDTLVVETSGFKQGFWLDIAGTPASADAKFTYRIRKVHQGAQQGDWSLEVITTLDDPKYYTRSWSWASDYIWRPDKAPLHEFDCEYSVNRPDYISTSGLTPEPKD